MYTGDVGVDDEYGHDTTETPIGTWAWCFRFSTDNGASWTYADGFPLGSFDGYGVADAGVVTVAPIVEICDDGIDNDADTLLDCDDDECDGDAACVLPGADYATIQWPGGPTTVYLTKDFVTYGRVHVPGRTEAEGRATGVVAQWGYGPDGSDPSVDDTGWLWQLGSFSRDVDNDDEYIFTQSGLGLGIYAFCWRFSTDGGTTWLYGDNFPEGNTNGYDPTTSGQLTIAYPPVSYVAIDDPTTPITIDYGDSVTTRGRVYVEYFTEGVGEGTGVRGQFGYGARNSDPNVAPGWTWVEGTYVADVLNGWGDLHDDEYEATASGIVPGDYSWAWRFSADAGATWVYGDNFPGGTYDGYSPATAGFLTVTAPPEICDDFADNDFDGDTDCDDSDCALFCICETVSCNDGDACTIDSCTPGVGCLFTPIPGCTDGRECTQAEAAFAIVSPTDNQRFPLGYDERDPVLVGNVTLTFSSTAPDPSGDSLVIFLDDEAPVTIAVTDTHDLIDLDAGSHTLAVRLVDGTGKPYCGARDGVRFYLSRVCMDNDDCDDADPCLEDRCIAEGDLQGWLGRCRFGPDATDPDCCVNANWCDQLGLSFGEGPFPYLCADADSDGVGDCVQCVDGTDCLITSPCQTGAVCVDNVCEYTLDPDCCDEDSDCDDGIACTTDSCDLDANTCLFDPIEGCCLAGNETELPGGPLFGCTAADASPCLEFVCIGQGAAAECKHAQIWRECCAEDADCAEARLLTACVDPTGQGYARCAVETPTEVAGAYFCDYGPVDPECCTHDWQCAHDEASGHPTPYPQWVGTCTDDSGPDFLRCAYVENEEYCASPVTTLVINEVMWSTPVLGDPAGEWFEIFNPTAEDVDIDGWFVAQDDLGTEQFQIATLAGELIVPAGRAVALAASAAPEINGGFEPDYVYDAATSGFQLEATDGIALFNAAHEPQDQVFWDAWGIGSDNRTMALVSPYLDNAVAGNWATAAVLYGRQATVDSFGTPGEHNRDVFDDSLTADGPCDDGEPCTLDLCNYDKASLCAHLPLFDCCLTANTECNDYNVCTEDRCDTDSFHCIHDVDPDCCLINDDCIGVYPDEFDTVAEQTNFDLCATVLCVGGSCRFGRDRDRPGCCVSTDAGLGFGCTDRNNCTADACTSGAGGEGAYPACTYDADPNDDGTEECCFTSEDCDDGDPATLEICARIDYPADDPNCPGVPQSNCCILPNPLYCEGDGDCDDGLDCTDDLCCTGVGTPDAACTGADECVFVPVPDHPTVGACCESSANCTDGDACTTDVCCTGFGTPDLACLAANTCVHLPTTDTTCCDAHDDCREGNKPPEMLCREGYCIGGVCRFAPPTDEDCCYDVDDCDDGNSCTVDSCGDGTPNVCDHLAIPDCCTTGMDCVQPADPCLLSACVAGVCTEIELPNCCIDEDPALADGECEDGDPCTTDYCMDVGGKYQCRHLKTGGLGCCATEDNCPDDRVECTAVSCDANACQLSGEGGACVVTSPYEMNFTEGHAVYAGQYTDMTVFGWLPVELGASSLDPASWAIETAGPLGPDPLLRFVPAGGPATDFESCAALPTMGLFNQFALELSFTYAADVAGAGATIQFRLATEENWAGAELWGPAIPVGADAPETAYSTGRVGLPFDIVEDVGELRVLVCILGSSSDDVFSIDLDDVRLERFQTP